MVDVETAQKAKLELLALSQKMVMLAELQDWQQLQVVQQQWEQALPNFVNQFGKELDSINPTLLENASQLEYLIQMSQQHLASELSQSLQQNKSVKKYVKY